MALQVADANPRPAQPPLARASDQATTVRLARFVTTDPEQPKIVPQHEENLIAQHLLSQLPSSPLRYCGIVL
jgi:hypothetical protein